jgi:hypothetical protein
VIRRILAPALLLLAVSGCMKVREELVVMPDGSGRLTLTFSIAAKGEAGKFTQAELMSGDPDELQAKVRGLVALTRPTLEEKDGVVRIRMTAYFDDVNALKFMDDGEGAKAKPKVEFTFRKDGEAFTLEEKGNLLAEEEPERRAGDAEVQKFREEMFRTMFAGFELRHDVRLPGSVTVIEGFGSKDGRVATLSVGEKELQKSADLKKVGAVSLFRASCGKSEVTDSEAAEFRREIEVAKAAWPELRREMKKAAGGK